MKIAFIGTHGVGKTTLAYKLCNELKKLNYDVGYLDEVARRCPFPINEGTSLEAQIWIIATTISKELELSKIYRNVICDRSVIDNYVYLYHKFGHVPEIYSLVRYWTATYDHLFKVPVSSRHLSPDGVRSVDPKFQRDIDHKLERLLRESDLNYHIYHNMRDTLRIILAPSRAAPASSSERAENEKRRQRPLAFTGDFKI